jgi:hypothetical protein
LYCRNDDLLVLTADVLLFHWLHFIGLSLGWSSVVLTRLAVNEQTILTETLAPHAVEVSSPARLSHESVKHWRHIPCLADIVVRAVLLAGDGVVEELRGVIAVGCWLGCLSGTRLGCCVLSWSRAATTPDIPYSRDPRDGFEREAQEAAERPRAIGQPRTDDEHTSGYARELDRLRSQANADGNTEHSWEYEFLLV